MKAKRAWLDLLAKWIVCRRGLAALAPNWRIGTTPPLYNDDN